MSFLGNFLKNTHKTEYETIYISGKRLLGKAVNIRKLKHTCIESLNTQRHGN